MKFFCVILLFGVISAVFSAPANVKSLLDIVKSDDRTKELQKRKFLAECNIEQPISKSICLALYDVALSFNSKNLSFNLVNATYQEDTFCQALNQTLPDSPANKDSLTNFKDVQWFKDVPNDDCKKKCFYLDPQTYENKLKPVCQFLFNQYSFLYNQSHSQSAETQQQPQAEGKPAESVDSTKSVEKSTDDETKSSEAAKAEPVPAGEKSDIVTASNETSSQKFSSETTAEKVSENISGKISSESIITQEQKATSAPVVRNENTKAENASDVERKPLAQTLPATTTKLAPKTPQATTKATKLPEEDVKLDDQLKPDFDDEENMNVDKLPFDDAEASEIPEKDLDPKTEADYPNEGDDDDEYGGNDVITRDNNNVNNKLPQPPVSNNAESGRLEDPQTKIEQVAFEEDPDSNFFAYLCSIMFLVVFLYILHQNRQKLLALCLEGRRGNRRMSRSRGGSKAAYSKLDCNLEEAITSTKSMSGKSLDIIY